MIFVTSQAGGGWSECFLT